MELRDYQAEALAAIHATPCTRQLVALPTGAGKTVLFATLTRDRGPNALVIAHRTELITQAAERLECFYPGNVGILQADRRDLDAPVLVASVQTAPRHLAALTGLPVKDKESVKEAHRADRERIASKPAPEVLAVTVEPFELFRRSAFNWYQNDKGNWVLKTAAGYIVVRQTNSGRWNVGNGSNIWFNRWPLRTLPEALALAERIAIEKKTA